MTYANLQSRKVRAFLPIETTPEQTPHLDQDDEIDLRELLITLWKGKSLLLLTTSMISVLGMAYAFLTPEQWSAKAIVMPAISEQISQVQQRLEYVTLIPATGSNSNFANEFTKEKLFTSFIQAFDSFDNKANFLRENGQLPLIDITAKQEVWPNIEEATKAITAAQKKNEIPYTLSFTTDNAKTAVKQMNEYLIFIKNKEEDRVNKEFNKKILTQIQVLTTQYELQKSDTLKRLQDDITRTELALRASRAAGIENPVENLNNQTFFAVNLGSKLLEEKLKILKELKEPEILNPLLAEIRLQLDSLKALPSEKINFTPYSLLQTPAIPTSRDHPKRSLVMVLSLLSGFGLGVMVVLLQSWWRKTAI